MSGKKPCVCAGMAVRILGEQARIREKPKFVLPDRKRVISYFWFAFE